MTNKAEYVDGWDAYMSGKRYDRAAEKEWREGWRAAQSEVADADGEDEE